MKFPHRRGCKPPYVYKVFLEDGKVIKKCKSCQNELVVEDVHKEMRGYVWSRIKRHLQYNQTCSNASYGEWLAHGLVK